jgi:alpha-glucoside transport system substrate-binding protein
MKARMFRLFGLLVAASLIIAACAPAATPAPTAVLTDTPAPVQPTMAPTAAPTMAPTAAPVAAAGTIDCKGAASGDTLTLAYQWSGSEEESFNTILKPFEDACGVKINGQSTRDASVLDTMVKSTPPDVLFWPDLSPLKLYTAKLLPLDTVGGVSANYAGFWTAMGTVGGKWLAIPVKTDVKSIIWYSPTQFKAFNYTVPTTFADLQTLVDKMVADGNVPWSMGFNNGGAADGWTGADFIQDILLATQGPDYVNGLIAGTVPYNDPGVLAAYQIYQKWASDPKYTVGGANGTVNTKFLDAIYKVFANPPQALMVKQSGFAGGSIATQYPNLKYGTDYDFFEFPGVKGMQGGADFMMAFSNKPAAQALVAYLTGPAGAQNWAKANFSLSPNKNAAGYTDPQELKLAPMLANATGFAFSVGDALGAPFNTAQWKGVVSVVQGADIPSTLATIAAAQKQSIKK